MKIERPIPSKGAWFTRNNKGGNAAARYKDRPTDLVQIGEVDHDRREFKVLRVDGFGADGTPIVGRCTKINFETWAEDCGRRYEPIPPPIPPTPEEEPAPVSGVTSAPYDVEAALRRIEEKQDEILSALRSGPLFARAR